MISVSINSRVSGIRSAILAGIFFLLCLSSFQALAQETNYFNRNETYRKAIELYDHQSYASAELMFRKVYLKNEKPETSEQKVEEENLIRNNARFYEALCDMRLQNTGAEQKLLDLIATYPYAPMAHTSTLQIGIFYFSKGDYTVAAKWLKDIPDNTLIQEDRDELNFKYGFCLFKQNHPGEARINFKKVLDHPNAFQEDALYYDAHLAYEAKEYETALSELQKLPPSSKYHDIYPVYSSQIYLIKGDVDAAIRIAKPLVESSSNPYKPLLSKALGSAYFFKENYTDAAIQFDLFKHSSYSDQETGQDMYQIGYSYYKTEQFDKAIRELSELYQSNDVYAQSGLYTLGQCFLKTNQNPSAKSAFQLASQLRGNPEVTENSLLYYIKLSYEAGLDQDALNASRTFVKNYPHSASITEIKTLEGELLLHTRNYADAFQTLKSIAVRNDQAERAFQKVAYFYGLETYNDNDYAGANRLFDESIGHPKSAEFVSLAKYWKGESSYDMKSYDQALTNYQEFLSQENASSLPVFADAYYGLGYAYYKKGDYTRALTSFTNYTSSDAKDPVMKADAIMRMADCYFVLKNYKKASNLYTWVIGTKGSASDYATFQSAMLQGLQGNATGKLSSLQNLLTAYPNSTYADDAQFEIASAYFVSGKMNQARDEYNFLINKYPESSYIPRALLNIGLIYYNSNDDNNALTYDKQVVSKFPGSPEAKNALAAIKNIYIDQGNPGAYVSYANSSGITRISETGEDSLSYQSASTKYLGGDVQGSIASFNAYLEKFPMGNFASEAHFYRSQALQKQKRGDEALPDYEFLINKSTNTSFTENALVNASRIYLNQEKCERAIPYLRRLEKNAQDLENYGLAVSGLANCYSKMNNADSTVYYAHKVLANDKSSAESQNQANMLLGKANLLKDDTAAAERPLALAAKARNIYAAEARYLTADIQYNSKNYKASMKILFDLIKQLSNYDYWVAKSFVLLADNYTAQGDVFQARSTLMSVIQNYKPDDDVKKSAQQKLSELERSKK